MQLKWVNHRKNETLTCAAYSILTLSWLSALVTVFLEVCLGAAAASHRALTPVHSVCLTRRSIRGFVTMERLERAPTAWSTPHTACMRPLLDTLLQLIVELTKAKYRKEKSLWVNQNPNPFSGLYKPDLNSQYLYCSCSLLLRAGQHSASSEKLQCCCRVIASSPGSWPLQF